MNPEKRERIKVLRERAKALRKNSTASEDAFWQMVRARRFRGKKFRRQVVLDPYIVDFFCRELGLIVEIDGPVHASRRLADSKRQLDLERRGYRVFRFSDKEVLDGPGRVWKILAAWYDALDQD